MAGSRLIQKALMAFIAEERQNRRRRLPSERELAVRFGCSRATICKVLGILAGEGVVERRRGSGTFLTAADGRKNCTVALLIRCSYHYMDPYFRMIVNEASRCAEELGIYLQIYDRVGELFARSPDHNNLLEAVRSRLIQGALIVSRMPLEIVWKLHTLCPVVSVNNCFGDGSEIPCVGCDYSRIGYLAGEYLLNRGHRRIAYVTDELDHPESGLNLSGLQQAMNAAGLPLRREDVLETRRNPESMAARTGAFFHGPVRYSACVVRNGDCMSRLLPVFHNLGLAFPGPLSVIVGSQCEEKLIRLGIDSVDNHLAAMSRDAMRLLYNRLQSADRDTTHGMRLIPPQLAERGSVFPGPFLPSRATSE